MPASPEKAQRERDVLECVHDANTISTEGVAKSVGCSYSQAYAALNALLADGSIDRQRRGRIVYWSRRAMTSA